MPRDEEKVVIAGFGGQGVMLMGQILSYAATAEGINTVWIPSYGPETRGGTANCSVIISEASINSPVVSEPNTVIAMNYPSLQKFEGRIKTGGTLLVNTSAVKDHTYRDDIKVIKIDAADEALKLGNLKVANMIMLGAYLNVSGVFDVKSIHAVFDKIFTGDKAKLIDLNKQALQTGSTLVNA